MDSPAEFAAKWRVSARRERAASQEHFVDLCRLLGVPTPNQADPSGEWYTFEAGVQKLGGGQGRADVWRRDHFGWVYKGAHADLNLAYQQLLGYREALENPPILVVSDMDRIEVHTNFTNRSGWSSTALLCSLPAQSPRTASGDRSRRYPQSSLARSLHPRPGLFGRGQGLEVCCRTTDAWDALALIALRWHRRMKIE